MFLSNHFDELDDEVIAFHANYNDRQGQKEGMLDVGENGIVVFEIMSGMGGIGDRR